MSTLDFDHLKVTTMTIVMQLEGYVDLQKIFPLLEITRVELPPSKRKTKRCKIPHCSKVGAILSARYNNLTRGIIKTISFRNSITIDIATSQKNVSIKLSRGKIQMCGATSSELALEAADLIIGHLHRIQENLDTMRDNPDLTGEMLEWVRENTTGKSILSNGYIRHRIVVPTEYPEKFPKQVIEFLLSQAGDYLHHEDYVRQLVWLSTLDEVVRGPIRVTNLSKVMVNFNYDLGFSVNRWNLAHYINGRNGFYAQYDNSVAHSVTIELPYEPPHDETITRKKNKIPCHTFIVYKSGLVTQSGPNETLMRDAYNLFNATINEIRDEIERPDIQRKLRYKPIRQASVELVEA